jgi:hypothetical protein
MSNFPLYNTLNTDIPTKDLQAKQKDELVKKIKKIDKSGSELIYALIRTYQMENSDDISTFKLPYGGKFDEDNNIVFNVLHFPIPLRYILHKFVLLHTNTNNSI